MNMKNIRKNKKKHNEHLTNMKNIRKNRKIHKEFVYKYFKKNFYKFTLLTL